MTRSRYCCRKMNAGWVDLEAGGVLPWLGCTWPQVIKARFSRGNEDGVAGKEERVWRKFRHTHYSSPFIDKNKILISSTAVSWVHAHHLPNIRYINPFLRLELKLSLDHPTFFSKFAERNECIILVTCNTRRHFRKKQIYAHRYK